MAIVFTFAPTYLPFRWNESISATSDGADHEIVVASKGGELVILAMRRWRSWPPVAYDHHFWRALISSFFHDYDFHNIDVILSDDTIWHFAVGMAGGRWNIDTWDRRFLISLAHKSFKAAYSTQDSTTPSVAISLALAWSDHADSARWRQASLPLLIFRINLVDGRWRDRQLL